MKKTFKFVLGVTLMLFAGAAAFAQTSKSTNASQALSIVEALQTTFRSVSDTLLPSVVEVLYPGKILTGLTVWLCRATYHNTLYRLFLDIIFKIVKKRSGCHSFQRISYNLQWIGCGQARTLFTKIY